MANGRKAVDIYFNDSFFVNYLLNQKKGLYERPNGGLKIRCPLEYDEQVGGFYAKGDTISSDMRDTVNAAYFSWKHLYGNASIYRIDELENAGSYAEVQLISQRVAGAQKTVTKHISSSVYDDAGTGANRLTGLRAACNETATTKYGGLAENDLVATDGSKPWEGITITTTESLDLNVIRNMASAGKIRDGNGGKPDFVCMTETLYNVVSDILQVQQRFTESTKTADAGFTGLKFEGKDIFADDYCPTGWAFAFNSKHLGFAVHQRGLFEREKWQLIPNTAGDKTMKIYFDGNIINSCRKAHVAHKNLS